MKVSGYSGNHAHSNRLTVMWVAVGLAMVAALSYMLIAWRVLGVGSLQDSDAPAAIVYVCAACYFVGGLLILLQKRWLLMTGAVINALVMFFFFSAYTNKLDVMFSAGGLATKAAQLLLEIALLYLILAEGHLHMPRLQGH
ncbi:MAG TPA: hypothetical protein VH186_24540 [Chloroflexia bacterium]|nr:hypothetical protein [Chloroflexia bacterium]